MTYDVLILGSGPGGYVAAIRAAQLGLSVAVVEKSELGGVCLNWGCIPTKALLKSAEVLNSVNSAKSYGIDVDGTATPNFGKVIDRSRRIAGQMSKGIEFLFKKNNVNVIQGFGKIIDKGTVEIQANEDTYTTKAKHIIIATGARSRNIPGIEQDGRKIIGYKDALILEKLPESLTVIGSGAIGIEMAYFYASMGTKVSVLEVMPHILPNEDEDVALVVEKGLKKQKIKFHAGISNLTLEKKNDCVSAKFHDKKGEQTIDSEIVLSAVGIEANTDNIGLETVGVTMEKGKIIVNDKFQTSVEGIYAIGDVIATPALAHVASAEGIACVEHIAGHSGKVDYSNIPSCIYTKPEVASFGITEKLALKQEMEHTVSSFPFSALGKATAIGSREGFVKLIFDSNNKLIGGSLVGEHVTEMLSELVVAKHLDADAKSLLQSIHPHPSFSEAIMEAAGSALGEAIHL